MRENLARGYSAESLVIAFLHSAYIPPLQPIGDYESYDIAVVMNDVLVRVQVKCVSPKGTVDMRSSSDKKNKNAASKNFDVIAAVDVDKKEVYFIPMSALGGIKSAFNIKKYTRWKENIDGLVKASKQVRGSLCNVVDSECNTYTIYEYNISNDNGDDTNYGVLHYSE